jgi:hypothetical protein
MARDTSDYGTNSAIMSLTQDHKIQLIIATIAGVSALLAALVGPLLSDWLLRDKEPIEASGNAKNILPANRVTTNADPKSSSWSTSPMPDQIGMTVDSNRSVNAADAGVHPRQATLTDPRKEESESKIKEPSTNLGINEHIRTLAPTASSSVSGTDIVFLVDQSGSMSGQGATKTANDPMAVRVEAIRSLEPT